MESVCLFYMYGKNCKVKTARNKKRLSILFVPEQLPGGPRRRVPAARDGPHQPHPADQHAGGTGPASRPQSRRPGVHRTRRCPRSDRGSNRVVCRSNWIRTAFDVVRGGPPGGAAGSGSDCGGQPAGRRGVCGPSGMGIAGELVGNPRATAAGSGAYYQIP